MLPALADRLRGLRGWRRIAAAIGLGCVLTLCMAPLNFFPAALISVPGFIWLTQGCETRKQSFLAGWAFGCGYLISGFYWISAALFVDIGTWFWVLPLSLVVGPAVMALYTYSFIPLLVRPWRHDGVLYPVVFCVAWSAIEWLRGHLFTGFPWNLPAYMWHDAPPVMQLAALVGAYGLTLATLVWAALPAMADRRLRLLAAASFILTVALGGLRLWQHPTDSADSVNVRIVQANVPQTAKWSEEDMWRNLEKHARLSDPAMPADVVIWPETAVTTDPVMFPQVGQVVAKSLPPGSFGIIGSLRMTRETPEADIEYHNGVYLFDGQNRALASYDKFHLVPFGEYIPFRQWLKITPIAAGISKIGDFGAGPGPQTLAAGSKVPPFSPLICYEVIFPHAVVDTANARPEWLVNVTNDGWYGRSAGPYQHLEISRLRAVEEGLPLARAANTGISAMIDPLGRITAELPLLTEGALTVPLPHALPATPYARLGDIAYVLLALAVLAVALWRRKQAKTNA